MYIKRHIEDALKSAVNEKGALCVTDARLRRHNNCDIIREKLEGGFLYDIKHSST